MNQKSNKELPRIFKRPERLLRQTQLPHHYHLNWIMNCSMKFFGTPINFQNKYVKLEHLLMSKQAALWEFDHNGVFIPAEARKTFLLMMTSIERRDERHTGSIFHKPSRLTLVKMQSVFSRIGASDAVIEMFTAGAEISLRTHSERAFTADSSVHQGGSLQPFISSQGKTHENTQATVFKRQSLHLSSNIELIWDFPTGLLRREGCRGQKRRRASRRNFFPFLGEV